MRIAHENTKDIEILKNIVSLSQLKLDTLREGDLLNLKEDLYELVGRGKVDKQKFLQQLTMEQIATIQENFRHSFEALANGNKAVRWKIDTPMKVVILASSNKTNEPFDYQVVTMYPAKKFNRPDPLYTAGVSLLFLLIRSGVTPERFRKCPECDSIFLLLRKPDKRHFYCSPRCATRVATRNSRRAKREGGKWKMRMGGGSQSSKRRQDGRKRGTLESPEQDFMKSAAKGN